MITEYIHVINPPIKTRNIFITIGLMQLVQGCDKDKNKPERVWPNHSETGRLSNSEKEKRKNIKDLHNHRMSDFWVKQTNLYLFGRIKELIGQDNNRCLGKSAGEN